MKNLGTSEHQIYCGDSLETLKQLPEKSVDMVMTSPPYWALRDYGVDGQLGLEPTFEEYINKLCGIFDEVKRVLKDEGTIWINLGDTYGTTSGGMEQLRKMKENTPQYGKIPYNKGYEGVKQDGKKNIKMHKCLVCIPFRFAIEMINRGWILRNTIIWHKPNCMPSSAKDRFTVDFEYLFFFSKQKKYYFEKQYEPLKTPYEQLKKDKRGVNNKNRLKDYTVSKRHGGNKTIGETINPQGRNKRTVWKITTKPFKEAHFAVYPPELCKTPIKAGCPEFVCNNCEKPREKIIERIAENYKTRIDRQIATGGAITGGVGKNFPDVKLVDKGYTDCGCNAGFSGGIVLDPFAGAGTTGLVAQKLGRHSILIELNREYCEIIKKRLKLNESLRTYI